SRRRPTTRTSHTSFISTNGNSENPCTSRTIDAIDPSNVSEPSTTMAKKPIRTKEKEKKVKRAPTKERWLLTRKTWKYMADAGPQLHTIATTTMQKSKSSSNVGQVFSKKIWKSRSKSQTRTASPTESDGSGSNIKPNWMP
ncbi:hypothetical protein Bhyg_17318, partial [Pseudolycoriella hygida]